jgi:hypothetical protein
VMISFASAIGFSNVISLYAGFILLTLFYHLPA